MRDCSDDVSMAAFTNDLKDKDLIRSFYSKPPEDFDDIMSQAMTHMLTNEEHSSHLITKFSKHQTRPIRDRNDECHSGRKEHPKIPPPR